MPQGNSRRYDMARLYTFSDDVRICEEIQIEEFVDDIIVLGCSCSSYTKYM